MLGGDGEVGVVATVRAGSETIKMRDDDARILAYNALSIAGQRIAENNYRSQMAAHLKKKRKRNTFKFVVTDEHQAVVDAMPKVLSGDLSPNDAMAMLLDYDTFKQRMGK